MINDKEAQEIEDDEEEWTCDLSFRRPVSKIGNGMKRYDRMTFTARERTLNLPGTDNLNTDETNLLERDNMHMDETNQEKSEHEPMTEQNNQSSQDSETEVVSDEVQHFHNQTVYDSPPREEQNMNPEQSQEERQGSTTIMGEQEEETCQEMRRPERERRPRARLTYETLGQPSKHVDSLSSQMCSSTVPSMAYMPGQVFLPLPYTPHTFTPYTYYIQSQHRFITKNKTFFVLNKCQDPFFVWPGEYDTHKKCILAAPG